MNNKLIILHSNDMHGDFLAENVDGDLIGGVSMLSGYIKKVRSENENVIYAIAGDMFRGSIIDSEYKGISTIELMNVLDPDVACIGNHELDYGLSHLLFLEKFARFPIINANFYIKTNHKRLFQPYKVIECGGYKVLFIGIITEEILAKTKSEELIGSFVDVRAAAEEIGIICDNYKTADVDYTVILTHIGFEEDKALAELINPSYGVDLIIGGHSHTKLDEACVVNNIPIVQANFGTDQIGRMEITFDEDKNIESYSWQSIPIIDDYCPNDPVLEEILDAYKSQTDKKYDRIVTTFDRTLTHPSRTQETELGNLFADMLQYESSFDVMLFGSGSIRSDKLGPVVTYQNLKEVIPYDDVIMMAEVTGAQFRKMITHILREEAFAGHTEFYQFSKGMRIVYSRKDKALKELKLNGKEICDDDIIKIALQEYHLNNTEEFFGIPYEEIAANKRPREIIHSSFSVFEEMMTYRSRMTAKVEGRLVIEQ